MLDIAVAHEPIVARVVDVKSRYLEALSLIERLHRRLLDVIKDEFDSSGQSDVNSVQALLIFNIGASELTAGELRKRGCYLGSNVSYNLKKLVEAGYIRHERSQVDRRSVHISVTEKGLKVAQIINDLYDRHVLRQEVGGIDDDEFVDMNRSLKKLERFWTNQIRH